MDDDAARPSLRTSLRIGPNNAYLHNRPDLGSRLICSGEEVVMTTDDPVNRPLPNYNILERQWFLQRVCAIAAAAEIDDDLEDGDFFEDAGSYDETVIDE